MGGGQEAPQQQTQISRTEMNPAAQGYYNLYSRRAELLADPNQTPYKAYTGTRIAGLTPEQNQGLNLVANRATTGSPLTSAAQTNALNTIRGDYLNSGNPYFQQMADQVSQAYNRNVRAPSDFGFAQANAFGPGNSAWSEINEANNKGLADAIGNLAYQNYGQERANQMAATQFAPQLAAQDYADANALLSVGDARRQYNQDIADFNYQQWLEEQQYPYKQADILANIVGVGSGGGTTITQGFTPGAYKPSPLANAAGGALTGFSLGGPWGAAAGGGLGLLSSFL